MGVDRHDLKKLEDLVRNDRIQHSGDITSRQGATFDKIYAVKSGMYKSVKVDDEGHEHVTAFHLPGELIGLDAIYSDTYGSTTVALTTSALCQFNNEQLIDLASKVPALQRQLLRLLSKDISDANVFFTEQTAEQKLTGFIHNLLKRYRARGYSDRELVLQMTRQDIANHLGMAPETISRLLKRLQTDGVLRIKKREVTVLDQVELLRLAGCKAASQPDSVSVNTIVRSDCH